MSQLALVPINNFVAASAPASAVRGDVYYDTTLAALRYYDGTAWVSLGATTVTADDASLVIAQQVFS